MASMGLGVHPTITPPQWKTDTPPATRTNGKFRLTKRTVILGRSPHNCSQIPKVTKMSNREAPLLYYPGRLPNNCLQLAKKATRSKGKLPYFTTREGSLSMVYNWQRRQQDQKWNLPYFVIHSGRDACHWWKME